MKNPFYKLILYCIIILSFTGFAFAQTDLENGMELYKKGEYEKAVIVLKRATKNNSPGAQAWYYLGLAYLKQDREKESQRALEKAVALNGKDANIRASLAYVYMLRNNSQEAQKQVQAALAINPNIAEAHYILGVESLRNGLYNIAYERARKANGISPNFAAAYLLESESLVSSFAVQTGTVIKPQGARKELLKEAIEDLEKYVSLSADDKETKFHRESLESLKFFYAYYDRLENQTPVNFDASAQADNSKTPIKILSKPQVSYTDKARQAGVSGTIRLLVGFSEDGKVRHILVIKSLGYGLDQEAVRAARNIKFEPATKDGKPVPTVKTIEYTFMIY